MTADYAELLADPELDAVVIATPVPTHYALAKQALEAGKHVLVEKPPAMKGSEMDELVTLAAERDLVLMPGHLLLYHPGVRKLKELVDSGGLGEVLCVYTNRQNLGIVRANENALWSLGVHDLSVILWLIGEDPVEAVAHGRDFLNEGVEDVVFCYLRFPSGKIAHMHLSWLDPHKMRRMTVVGNEKMVVFDDMELERKVTVYEKGPWKQSAGYGEWQTRTGDIHIPKIDTSEPLRLECEAFLELIAGDGDRAEGRRGRRDGRSRARPLDRVAPCGAGGRGRRRGTDGGQGAAEAASGKQPERRRPRGGGGAEIHPTATVYEGTVLGQDVKVLEGAVVGKQPTLSPRSTAKREPLEPTTIGDGTIVSTGAIVFAGSRIGARVILGDQSCVRERVEIGDDVVLGRGSYVENDTTVGAMTKIQADAYITAYSTLEEHVFIAPCVVTTNDNYMGRTEKRLSEMSRARRSAAARASAAARFSAPESRSARRPSSAPARS